jgi:hypothetical protein
LVFVDGEGDPGYPLRIGSPCGSAALPVKFTKRGTGADDCIDAPRISLVFFDTPQRGGVLVDE